MRELFKRNGAKALRSFDGVFAQVGMYMFFAFIMDCIYWQVTDISTNFTVTVVNIAGGLFGVAVG